MTDEFKWETPPPKAHRGGRAVHPEWSIKAAALRERPGEWALVAENASATTATMINRGTLKAFADGDYEATTRLIADTNPRRYRVYARFVSPSGVRSLGVAR